MSKPRTALVTGAAAGIGAAIAKRFLAEGYAAALFDRNVSGMQEIVESSGAAGRSLVLPGDAGQEQSIREAVARTEKEFGAIDVLINNVGIEKNATATEQTREEWDEQITVNLTSIFLFSKFGIPAMRARGGAIINIASTHSFLSWPRCAAYDASKAGVLGITRSMAIDYGPDGIRVNAICPGYVRTPMLEQWFAMPGHGEEEVARLNPLRRIAEPADIANAAFFLASEQAAYITGIALAVDGGMMAAGH